MVGRIRRDRPIARRPRRGGATMLCVPLVLVALAGCSAGVTGSSTETPSSDPVVTIVAVSESVVSEAPLEFHVRARPAPTEELTVNVEITVDPDGCAVLQSAPSTVVIAASVEQAALTVRTSGTVVDADSCTVSVMIAPGEGYEVGEVAEASASTTIMDIMDISPEPQGPVVTIAADLSPVVEGGQVAFTLTAAPAPASPLTVNVSWSEDGSFLAGSRAQTVTIPTSGSATLSADTDDDGTEEAGGSVTVTILGGSGYTIGTPASATVTVTDNDGRPPTPQRPAVTIAADVSPVVEGGQVAFTLTAAPAPASPLTVNVSWSKDGLFLMTGSRAQTVTIPTSGSATLSAATVDDSMVEAGGSVTVTILGGSGYTVGTPASATVSVTDNDGSPPTPEGPAVTIARVVSSVVEGGQVSFTLTATPSPASPVTVNLSWSQSQDGSFLTGTRPGTATIPTSGTVTVSAATDNDNTNEDDGWVRVTVGGGSGYTVGTPASATVTVTDNDTSLVGIQSITPNPVTEGGTITITFSISPPLPPSHRPPHFAIDFRVTDSSSATYGGSRSKSADPGDATTRSTHVIVDDDPVTTNRTVIVTVEPNSSNPNYAVGTPRSKTVNVTDAN